jgi:peroxiredoxin
MRNIRAAGLYLAVSGMLGLHAQTAPPKTHLKPGDLAPEFSLPATTGGNISLSQFKGKRPVVLAFFPAAFSGGCTKEMTAYQAGIAAFDASEAQVLAISTDNRPTLQYWSKEVLKTSFPLLSDFMRKVSAAYGVLNPETGTASRTTFVIGLDGRIVHIEEGADAIDPNGAANACARVRKP